MSLASTQLFFFFFKEYGAPRDLHSFPTRRSSDLSPPKRAFFAIYEFDAKVKNSFFGTKWRIVGDTARRHVSSGRTPGRRSGLSTCSPSRRIGRSEEHTSELQSQSNLVCRLLLEKK